MIKFPQLDGLNLDSEKYTSILSIYRKNEGSESDLGLEKFTQILFAGMTKAGITLANQHPLALPEFDMCSKTAYRAELFAGEKTIPVRIEWFSEHNAVYENCWEGETINISVPQSLNNCEILVDLVNPTFAECPDLRFSLIVSDGVVPVDVEPDSPLDVHNIEYPQ